MASNEAALLIKLLADKSNLEVTLKDAEGTVQTFGQKVSSGVNMSIGKLGDNLLKLFGAGMLGKAVKDTVMGFEEVDASVGKLQDTFDGLMDRTLRPSIPYITKGISAITEGIKYIFAGVQVLGAFLGTFFSAVVLNIQHIAGAIGEMLKGNFKGAVDLLKKTYTEDIPAFKATMSEAWTKANKLLTENVELHKKTKKEIEDENKAIAEQIKLAHKARMARLAAQKEIDEKALKDKEAFDAAEAQALAEKEERYMAKYNKIAGAINDVMFSAMDNFIDKLFQGGQAWDEWAEQALSALTKVIAKMLILNTLQGLLGGITNALTGNILGAVGIKKSAVGGGVPGIQIITADPTTTVKIINNAYASATPNGQAGLYRNVQRGALADIKR